jgi:hypothetical protein
LRLWPAGSPPQDKTWTTDSTLELSELAEGQGVYYWQVGVLQLDSTGAYQGMASGWSATWAFTLAEPSVSPTPDPRYSQVNPYNTPPQDIAALIEISNPAEAEAKRQAIREAIWGPGGYPAETLPAQIEADIPDPFWADVPGLARIDRLTISMELGVESYPYLFLPQEPNGELLIYHEGSDGGFSLRREAIAFFIERGYSVLAFAMPFLGDNNRPQVFIPRLGQVNLPAATGFHLYLAEGLIEQGVILKLYLEPVIVGLNYADTLGFSRSSMVGLSGGGWTTHLIAAIDPRIKNSYPVAGSIPLYQRFDGHAIFTDLNAYVQLLPGLFPVVNYEELYVLGAEGAGRRQVMVINQYDRCCFWGLRYQDWEGEVAARAASLEGEFRVFLDSSHVEHMLSPMVLEMIAQDLAETARP